MLSKLEAKILNFELSDKAAVAAAVEENQSKFNEVYCQLMS
jgi:hypothetical protein